jgi:uncharacterized BrkB/YihY/UPF0761 family membrane protein
LNAVYGAFGAVVVLLLWAYIAGWVIVLGSCLSAAQAEVKAAQAQLSTAGSSQELTGRKPVAP